MSNSPLHTPLFLFVFFLFLGYVISQTLTIMTLLVSGSNDQVDQGYLRGVGVLASSLKSHVEENSLKLICICDQAVSDEFGVRLNQMGWELVVVAPLECLQHLNSEQSAETRERFRMTCTKLYIFQVAASVATQYHTSTILYLDADILCLSSFEHLFLSPPMGIAMKMDRNNEGWNTGVILLGPQGLTSPMWSGIIEYAKTHISTDSGDQGILNMYLTQKMQEGCDIPAISALPQYTVEEAGSPHLDKAVFLHFLGHGDFKPWAVDIEHWERMEFIFGRFAMRGGALHFAYLLWYYYEQV
jgi:lipopolysaccharide biosynthesis glycosyltransferase